MRFSILQLLTRICTVCQSTSLQVSGLKAYQIMKTRSNGLAHEILVLIENAQKPPFNSHEGVFRGAQSLFTSLSLPLLPCFEYVRSEVSGETARIRRLV